jgi:hypothetical protein
MAAGKHVQYVSVLAVILETRRWPQTFSTSLEQRGGRFSGNSAYYFFSRQVCFRGNPADMRQRIPSSSQSGTKNILLILFWTEADFMCAIGRLGFSPLRWMSNLAAGTSAIRAGRILQNGVKRGNE